MRLPSYAFRKRNCWPSVCAIYDMGIVINLKKKKKRSNTFPVTGCGGP
jgi:hypothetical protein